MISIIVPVYNVEKYLNRCVESIIHQSYKNLEILLIDDGSTDKSGGICDVYSKNDPRIKVVHKENGGLSDARNTGIDIANGEYIGFIDPDDWVSLDMYYILYNAIKENNADLVVCEAYYAYEDHVHELNLSNDVFVLNKEQALISLIEDRKFRTNAWNKLYNRRLLKDIRFPVGKYYEDIHIMHKVYDICTKVVFVDRQLYYYYQRSDSIVHTPKIEPLLDLVNGTIERYDYLVSKYNNLQIRLSAAVISSILTVHRTIGLYNISVTKEIYSDLKNKFEKYNKKSVIKYLSKRLKLEYCLYIVSPNLLYASSKHIQFLCAKFKGES